MKNKIVSAMLLGMSVSVAIPGTAAMALEESAAEQSSTVETVETAEASEPVTEAPDPIALMEAYADDTDAKLEDTPDGFASKLGDVEIADDAFGKYAEGIREYIQGSSIDMSSLYDAEMDAADQASILMVMEDEEASDAAKYHIALAFEDVFGESAFAAGRDIRRQIDAGKDDLYAACTSISELDAIYEGVKDAPSAYLPVETAAEAVKEETTDSEDAGTFSEQADALADVLEAVTYEGTGTTEENEAAETTGDTEAAAETGETEAESLEDYCSNIDDIVITVGSPIENSVQILDTSKVDSVTINASEVNINIAGIYTITYVIVGNDGTQETVEKNCTVEEDDGVTELRKEMCAAAEAIGSDLTNEDVIKEWEDALTKAEDKINSLTEEADMQAVLDALQATHDSLLSAQQLIVAKEGYVKELNDYCASLDCQTETEKSAVEQARAAAVEKINAATTIQEAADALEEGKENASKALGSLDAVKELALEKINSSSTVGIDTTSISENIYAVLTKRLEAAEDAAEVESIVNTAQRVFADVKTGLAGALSGFDAAYTDLKGLAEDADTTDTVNLVIACGTTVSLEDAEYRTQDVCKALSQDVTNFCLYLSSRVGVSITASTKAEAYEQFIQYFDDNELSNAKKAAEEEALAALDEVDVGSDSTLKTKKTALQAEIKALIEAATDTDGVATAKAAALAKVDAFRQTVTSAQSLTAAKEAAVAEVNAVVSAQTETTLYDSLFALARTYNSAIEAATSESEVSSLLSEFNSNAATVIQKYAEDQSLASTISATLTKIANLVSSSNGSYITTEMDTLVTNAKADVKAASSEDECNSIYNTFKASFSSAYLTAMRSAYVTKTEALLNNSSLTDSTYIAKAEAVVEKQVANIKNSTTEDAMENCYALAKKQVAAIVKEAKALASAKSEAVAKLKSEYSNPTDNQSTILDTYIDKINAATTTSEVSSLLSQAESALDSAGSSSSTSSGSSDSAAELEAAKTSAIAYIKEMYESVINKDSVSSTDKEAATTIYNNYKSAIEAATSVSAVEELKEKCATELEKYGANRPAENTDTSTTANGGSGSGDATGKAAEVSSTGTAKTGDNNMGVIAAAFSAMLASIAAAFGAFKKLRRS